MASGGRHQSTAVYIESGTRRVFACAFDWPGWCRSGKDEADALAALAATSPRYALVASEAGFDFQADTFDVVERFEGSGTTNFGVPDRHAASDAQPLTTEESERLAVLLEATWKIFDDVVASAPQALRKGPRGGGRDRDPVVQHVLNAEAGYTRRLGLKLQQPDLADRAAITRQREAIVGALRGVASQSEQAGKRWPLRYAARRIGWHVLDHAWEIEDRSAG